MYVSILLSSIDEAMFYTEQSLLSLWLFGVIEWFNLYFDPFYDEVYLFLSSYSSICESIAVSILSKSGIMNISSVYGSSLSLLDINFWSELSFSKSF